MAKRFFCDFYDERGGAFEIEIWDSEFSGTAVEFHTTAQGYALRYAQVSERTDVFMPAECSVQMQMQSSAHEALVTDLQGASEGRFSILIRDNTITPKVVWVGMVVPDIGHYNDENFPTEFEIRATDGLGILKDIEYSNSGTAYTGKVRAVDHVVNCLKKLPYIAAHFGDTDIFVRSHVDWWETTMTHNSSSSDALYQTYIDHAAFLKHDKEEINFLSCYSVLESILTTFGARMTSAHGAFWIEQLTYRTAATIITREYAKTGAFLQTRDYAGANVIDQTNEGALIATGTYEFLPALSRARHTFKSYERRNFLNGAAISNTHQTQTMYMALKKNGGNTTLRLTGSLVGTVVNLTSTPILVPVVLVLKIKLILDTVALKRAYFLNTNYQINYGPLSWETGTQVCYVAIPLSGGIPPNSSPVQIGFTQAFDIQVPELTEDVDDFIFGVEFDSLRYFSGSSLTAANFDFTWSVKSPWLEVYSNGSPALLADEVEYETVNTLLTSNSAVHQSQSLVGTSTDPNTLGALWVKPSSTYVLATDWGDGTDTPNRPIESMLTEFVVSGQHAPVRTLNGRLFGDITAMRRVSWRGVYWVLLGGTYDAGHNELEGQWVELAYLPGLSASPPKRIRGNITIILPPVSPDTGLNGAKGLYEIKTRPPGTMLYPAATTTANDALIEGDVVDEISVPTLDDGDFFAGDQITIVNPFLGLYETLTVSTTSISGDTVIHVDPVALTYSYPPNCPLIRKPVTGTFSLPAGALGQVLRHNGGRWRAYGDASFVDGTLMTWTDALGWHAAAPATSGTVTGTGAAGQVAFWTASSAIGGENALWYDATNDRLGVGTNSPAERLHVAGKAKIKADSGATNVTLESDNAWDVVFVQFQTADRVLAAFRSTDNNQRFSIELGAYETAMLLSSGLNNSKSITIQSSNLKLQSGTSPYPYFFEFGNNSYSPYGQDASLQTDLNLQFRGRYSHIQFPVNHAEVGTSGAYWSVGRGAGNSDKFQIRIQQAGANSFSDALTILATGTAAAKAFQYMGVGTASPSEALHIVGNLRFSGALMPNGSAGTTGYILISAGAGSPPVWRLLLAADIPNLPASIISSGILPFDRGGTGTGTIGTAGQLARVNSGATALEYFTATYLTANQTITISGDATGSGATSIALTLAANVVTFAKFQQISTSRLLGRSTAGTGNVEQISIGSGLSLSGGVLSASVGLGGSLTATRIPFAADSTTLDDDANLTWDDTNKRLSIGNTGGSPQAQLHIADGSVSGTWEGWRAIATASANVVATLYNAYNLGAAGNTIYDIGVGGSSAGDPMIRFLVSSIGQWCIGVDNSDGDKFRILYDSTPTTANVGITITNAAASLVGINKNAPSHPLDVAGRSRADLMQGVSGTLTSVFGTGAGTGPTKDALTGTANGFSLQFTTGTSPTANGNVISINVPTSFSSTQYPVFCAANAQTATDLTKFYISAANSTSFTLTANGTLSASTTYKFYFNIWGI